MRKAVKSPSLIGGSISPPGDKSISHRALLLNAVARGQANITGLSEGEDVHATTRCLKAMGARIEPGVAPGSAVVHGAADGLQEPGDILDAGNSGTSMRLLAGLLAAQPFTSVLTGDASLKTRPMGRVVQPLKEMGARILGRQGDTLAPLAIGGGGLKGIEYVMPVASAQVKSSIMLGGLSADGETVLHQLAKSRDHTERMLAAMGAPVQADGLTLTLQPGPLRAVDVDVPGDISCAAFWMVAGLCHPDARITLRNVGLNPGRTGIIQALQAMDAGSNLQITEERSAGGEPAGDVTVQSGRLKGIEIGGEIIPSLIDELPVLAVAACFAEGVTVIRDAGELRVKESDRIETTVRELKRLGASIEAREDGMIIQGTGSLQGADCQSYGDHRLAMALAVAGLLAKGETIVCGADAAAVSYPEFWQHLDQLCGAGQPEG